LPLENKTQPLNKSGTANYFKFRMRTIALILVALAITAFADDDTKLSDICQPYTEQGKLIPYPFPGGLAGRKLLFSSEDDIELVNNGRELSTVSMYWSFWQTKKGACVATPTLPPAFVTAATFATQKVAPGKSCKRADFIGGLTDSIVAEYKSECPDSTAGDLLLNRVCYYQYGSRHSSTISGKFTCKAGPVSSIKQVWAEEYPRQCPACTTVGTWRS
jgi:hypothetical protein